MPRKRMLQNDRAERLKHDLHHVGYMGLYNVRSDLSRHYKRTEPIMTELSKIMEDYKRFQKRCELELSKGK